MKQKNPLLAFGVALGVAVYLSFCATTMFALGDSHVPTWIESVLFFLCLPGFLLFLASAPILQPIGLAKIDLVILPTLAGGLVTIGFCGFCCYLFCLLALKLANPPRIDI